MDLRLRFKLENFIILIGTVDTVRRVSRKVNCNCVWCGKFDVIGGDSSFIKSKRKIGAGYIVVAVSLASLETRAAINSNSRADSMQCRYQASTNNAIRLAVIIDNALCAPGETFHKDTGAART